MILPSGRPWARLQPVHRRVRISQICLTALVACGTRAVIDAAFGPRTHGETTYGQRLTRSLNSSMIVLLDRGFATNAFLQAAAATGAAFLTRLSAIRKPPVLCRLPDGSFLSRIGPVDVRVFECDITVATTAGAHTSVYRPATILLDARTHPASELVRLYHERWEVESAYYALKKTMLGRRVLRARTLPGIGSGLIATPVTPGRPHPTNGRTNPDQEGRAG